MWLVIFLVSLTCLCPAEALDCRNVLKACLQSTGPWTRCYETQIANCTTRGRFSTNFIQRRVDPTQEAEVTLSLEHRVQIPSSALLKSRGSQVQLVATVLNSTFFKLSPAHKGRGRKLTPEQPSHQRGTVLGRSVLFLRAGHGSLSNLPQPIRLTFKHHQQVDNGTCVFWKESEMADGTGHWSSDGCNTSNSGTAFVCSCNHLSFFAVLVNPQLSLSATNAVNLSYITYIGSALSSIFTLISLIIYIRLQRRRPEKVIGVHMQLTGALLCLHLSFLLCSFWQLADDDEGLTCRALGLILHWSLLATVSWAALEGFHLYLLLVRVFNIYVKRYLLKLSLVGWGLPTLVAVVCGASGVYGRHSLELKYANTHSTSMNICWMSSQFPQMHLVIHVTTVAFPCLVVVYNSCMLGLVVFKLWRMRGGGAQWKLANKETVSRLWRDCVTVVGLSCLLGLPWGLASTTYISLPGIYIFTILNSLQGVFVFLWSVALTCKSRPDDHPSSRDPSTQKMMTTSFNN